MISLRAAHYRIAPVHPVDLILRLADSSFVSRSSCLRRETAELFRDTDPKTANGRRLRLTIDSCVRLFDGSAMPCA